MKKIMVTLAFGALLVVGFAAAQDAPTDSAMEWEPKILSVGQDVSHF
ncbi:hypothetical protein SAMN04488072_10890 [Lentibacillus halodurans]|uniref:Uncharacterized protein n=1 Tax=Lentibacillus halodurans TaxID=237679 RepID=A0A1I0YQ46_9BACI|nr:hypothetical protein [Lentibacillus halodurans]SFB15341.1 hypothetical protein SAMN04488072_10890 [Lentibacillus halodurans]